MIPWLTVELTSRCNKSCWFCGRAKIRQDMELGDMSLYLFRKIISEYNGTVIQFSKDGEPLLYEKLDWVVSYCQDFVTNIVTNGILLWDRKDVLLDNFTTVTVSVMEDDPVQFETIKKFKEFIGNHNPKIFVKFLGTTHVIWDDNNFYNLQREFESMGIKTMKREIHHPDGDYNYENPNPIIPEIGICQDFLFKPAIDWQGRFYICNRFDPKGKGVIGDCNTQTLEEIWNSRLRKCLLNLHKKGMRDLIPLCKGCQFWGVARG